MQTSFDEDNLVPNVELVAHTATLAQKLGVAELIDQHVKLPADAAGRANCGTKAMTVIGAMLAGRRFDRRCRRAACGRRPGGV